MRRNSGKDATAKDRLRTPGLRAGFNHGTRGSSALNNVTPLIIGDDVERMVARRRSLVPASWRRKIGRASTLVESFYHAFHGVVVGLQEQRNLRIHFLLAIVATIAGVTLKIDMASWMALVIVMALVIAAEFLNTSLEHLVDISADGQYHDAARAAKDTAAAAVLAVSLAALAVGAMVFGPKLFGLFFNI